MKTWLTKFSISSALDERNPLAPATKRALARFEAWRRIAEDAAELDRTLKNSVPKPKAPASLHAGIMRAVRSAKTDAEFNWQNLWERLIPASALALLVGFMFFGAGRSSEGPAAAVSQPFKPSLAAVSSTLESGGSLVRAMPVAALSPLTDEMLGLKRDLTNAQEFLLASLP